MTFEGLRASTMAYGDSHVRLPISKTNSTGDQSQMASAVFFIFSHGLSRVSVCRMWSHQESAIIGAVATPEAGFVDPSPTEIRHRIGHAV